MEVTLSSQLLGLGISVLVGLALAAVYDIFRVTRILFRTGKYIMYLQDILYGALAAFVTFLLALSVNSGEVRFYIIGGELVGMTVYFLSIGRLTVRIARFIYKICARIYAWFNQHILIPVKKGCRKVQAFIVAKRIKMQERKKISARNNENPLKPEPDLVYNRIISFFTNHGKELKGGIPEDERKS